jgi:hypothetical protein
LQCDASRPSGEKRLSDRQRQRLPPSPYKGTAPFYPTVPRSRFRELASAGTSGLSASPSLQRPLKASSGPAPMKADGLARSQRAGPEGRPTEADRPVLCPAGLRAPATRPLAGRGSGRLRQRLYVCAGDPARPRRRFEALSGSLPKLAPRWTACPADGQDGAPGASAKAPSGADAGGLEDGRAD